jgi:hypothetical protein
MPSFGHDHCSLPRGAFMRTDWNGRLSAFGALTPALPQIRGTEQGILIPGSEAAERDQRDVCDRETGVEDRLKHSLPIISGFPIWSARTNFVLNSFSAGAITNSIKKSEGFRWSESSAPIAGQSCCSIESCGYNGHQKENSLWRTSLISIRLETSSAIQAG